LAVGGGNNKFYSFSSLLLHTLALDFELIILLPTCCQG